MPERKFFIAGVKFRGIEAINELKQRQVGDMLEMEKEPENKYDPNAVKLISNGTMVGTSSSDSAPKSLPCHYR